MKSFLNLVMSLLENPRQILMICVFFGLLGTLFDGTLYRLWALKNDQIKVNSNIAATQLEIMTLQRQIKMAHDPKFIEREARDRFDLVDENDIVFVFSDD